MFEQEVTLPLSGVLDIPGTGLKFAFSEAEQDKAKSFLVGDTYTVSTTAPQMSNQDVLAAMDKLRNVSFSFEFVHIVGESAKPPMDGGLGADCEAARYVQEAALCHL
ncbi:DUF2586 family protein [Paenibacillus melissococcoides]|uniref:DUF2586 family protein n=1 Tax=Paenibacillus melissococcoides TaxID=2912268 RepID=UPI0021C34EDD|nr:DUF2586 family protein [Paenibacillus melissococcoides]CAH8721940.1 DUF2586 family protein [Paenibacillus melissococcoides]